MRKGAENVAVDVSPGVIEGARPAAAAPSLARRASASALKLGEAYALVGLAALVAGFFTLLPETAETFPTAANFQAVASNQSVIAIVALAALVPLVTGNFDLSVGATLGLASVMSATVISDGAPIVVGLVVAVGVGVVVGTLNGLLVTRARINAVITTFGMATLVSGAVIWKTGGEAISRGIPSAMTDFGSGSTFGVPRTVYALAAVSVIMWYLLAQTPFGRYLYALGSNPEAARLVGLRKDVLIFVSFVIAGALAGFAGLLQVARAGTADPQVGELFTLPALAAAFLSAAAIKPGRYNVGGVLAAIFFLAILNSGLNLAGVQTFVNDFVNGGALILGVGLAGYLGRRRTV